MLALLAMGRTASRLTRRVAVDRASDRCCCCCRCCPLLPLLPLAPLLPLLLEVTSH
jgi:hypothetical protein